MCNFRDKVGQTKFFNITETTNKFEACFASIGSEVDKINKFMKTLDDTFHQAFRKIRIKPAVNKESPKTKLEINLKLKSDIKLFIKKSTCKIGKIIAESKLENIENEISEEIADKNAELIKEQLQHLDATDGSLSMNGM